LAQLLGQLGIFLTLLSASSAALQAQSLVKGFFFGGLPPGAAGAGAAAPAAARTCSIRRTARKPPF
jgi:hypothetical protein